MNGYIGTKEAAARLNISVRRVQVLIAAGRLPAEKIGKIFAVREADLLPVDNRKNGRPRPLPRENSKKVPVDIGGRGSKSLSRKRTRISKQILQTPPHQRTQEDWDAILDTVLGSVSLGPSDLSTNKKYLEGLGRDKFFRR